MTKKKYCVEPVVYENKAYVEYNENDDKQRRKEIQEIQNGSVDSPYSVLSTEEKSKLKWSILKNVLCLSFSFTLLFTSFNSMSNLQSSLYRYLGTSSLAAIYVALVSSCIFLPTLLIKKLRPKWTVFCSMLLYCPYLAVLYFPRYYTFIPAAILLGLAGAPLWASKCTYLSKIGERYSEVSDESFDVVIVRFFGIFFILFQASQVFGNLISSTILSAGVSNFTRSEEFLDQCGSNFCPSFDLGIEDGSTNQTLNGNSTVAFEMRSKIYIMTSIYILLGLSAAAFVGFLVDPLSRYDIHMDQSQNVKQLLLATLNHIRNPKQLLIIPLTIFSGLQQGFLSADYTSAYVTCSIGVHMVGYAILCYGVSDAIFSFAYTPLMKYTKRIPLFTFGFLLDFALMVSLLAWKPDPKAYYAFFIIPAFWGMADAVWQTQINAFYGVIFSDNTEAAFSNYRLWESVGFIMAYVMGGALCINAKLYINLVFLCVGIVGYYVIEVIVKRKRS